MFQHRFFKNRHIVQAIKSFLFLGMQLIKHVDEEDKRSEIVKSSQLSQNATATNQLRMLNGYTLALSTLKGMLDQPA